jgi:PAS domain S-box-containing protein
MNTTTFTILIVEDFQADRELYHRSLLQDANYSYQILAAETVAEGLALCQTRFSRGEATPTIDAILLDYALPDGDGLEFLEALSVQSNGSIPPVVMLTGHGNESIAVQAMKLGAQDYLVKSNITPERLRSTLQSAILQGRDSAEENTRLRRQLQHSNHHYRVSMDNLVECLGIYSAIRDEAGAIIDFRFDYLNAAALKSQQMTGSDIGKRLCELFPNIRTTGLFAEYCQVVATSQPLFKEDFRAVEVVGGRELTRAYNMHISKLDDGVVSSWREIATQQQADLAIRKTTQQTNTIWENMTDAYVALDRDWRVTYTNQAGTNVFYELVGLTPQAFLGKTHWEIFPWSVGSRIELEYRRAVAERVSVHFDIFYEPTETWFEVHAYPASTGLGVYFRNINERKQIEVVQLAAEQERDRFFNLSVDLMAIGNFEGYFVRINPAFEQILGFTSAELLTRPFLDFVHPDDLEMTIAGVQGLSTGARVVSYENRYRCQDGSYRWILWSAMPYPERSIWYAIGHDITDRKQVDALIQESETKFSAIFNQTFELVGLLDLDGIVLELNQTALNSVDAHQSQLVGKYFWETPWWSHSPQFQHQLQESIVRVASGQLVRFEMYFPNAGGTLTAIDFSLKPVLDRSGRVTMMLAEGHDITARNQTQAALEERNLELDSFVYIVSHDLKAPLRAVANLSEWIEEDFQGTLSAQNQQQMTLLRSRVQRMVATIEGLLQYARAGSTDDTIESVDVAQLLGAVIAEISPPPKFTISIAPNLPTLNTKRLLLSQVFANLIGNGIEHHDAKDGAIEISYQDRGDFYEFSIADDGPGIAPEQHDRMFKIFQAVNPQNRADSTGIGLAIVKKIIESQGGTIRLESALGQGTTFYFTWPQR